MWNTVTFWVTQNMTTIPDRGILASSLPLAFQEMYQCEAVVEIVASYLVGKKSVRQERHFPCCAIFFTEWKKNYFVFMMLHLYLKI